MKCHAGIFVSKVKSETKLATSVLISAVFFGSSSDAVSTELLGVKLAVKNAPLFAVFQNFLFHRRDFLAGFNVPLLFFSQLIGEESDDVLADGVAVFDEFDFIARDEHVHHFVGQPDNFFSRESHLSFS